MNVPILNVSRLVAAVCVMFLFSSQSANADTIYLKCSIEGVPSQSDQPDFRVDLTNNTVENLQSGKYALNVHIDKTSIDFEWDVMATRIQLADGEHHAVEGSYSRNHIDRTTGMMYNKYRLCLSGAECSPEQATSETCKKVSPSGGF